MSPRRRTPRKLPPPPPVLTGPRVEVYRSLYDRDQGAAPTAVFRTRAAFAAYLASSYIRGWGAFVGWQTEEIPEGRFPIGRGALLSRLFVPGHLFKVVSAKDPISVTIHDGGSL